MNDLVFLLPIVIVGLALGGVMFKRKVSQERRQQHRQQVLHRLNSQV